MPHQPVYFDRRVSFGSELAYTCLQCSNTLVNTISEVINVNTRKRRAQNTTQPEGQDMLDVALPKDDGSTSHKVCLNSMYVNFDDIL